MSKRAMITWTLGMATLAIVGAVYLYSSSNKSSADLLSSSLETTIVTDEPTTLTPPEPETSTSASGTPTPEATTTPDSSSTPADASSTTPTTTSSPDSTTSTSESTSEPTASETTTNSPATDNTNSTSDTKPKTSTTPTESTSGADKVTSTQSVKTITEIKQLVNDTLVMHRTVSADKSRDAISLKFSIYEANAPVTITIQSDPIVVRTVSDKDGNVSYEITDPLKPGDHTLTISITDPKDPAKIVSIIKPFTLPEVSTSSDLNSSANLITKERIVIPIQYLFALVLSILVTSAVAYAIYRRRSARDTDLTLEG